MFELRWWCKEALRTLAWPPLTSLFSRVVWSRPSSEVFPLLTQWQKCCHLCHLDVVSSLVSLDGVHSSPVAPLCLTGRGRRPGCRRPGQVCQLFRQQSPTLGSRHTWLRLPQPSRPSAGFSLHPAFSLSIAMAPNVITFLPKCFSSSLFTTRHAPR